MSVIFDIETGPQELDDLLRMYSPPEEKDLPRERPFDFDGVKYGNTKDPDKRDVILAKAKTRHTEEMNAIDGVRLDVLSDHWNEFYDKAALSPVTGRVLCIGYYQPLDDNSFIDDGRGHEKAILNSFWTWYEEAGEGMNSMIGLNINDFDLPFLKMRSHILGVHVPHDVLRNNRYWNEVFVDLREIFHCGKRIGSVVSNFTHLSKVFGTAGKFDEGEVSGKDFHKFWFGTKEERELAIKYLEQDIRQPAEWAMRMGVIKRPKKKKKAETAGK
jgi:hypothetical protein